jgi:hypothetical protein
MRLNEIRKRYRNEWVLVEFSKLDKDLRAKDGRVIDGRAGIPIERAYDLSVAKKAGQRADPSGLETLETLHSTIG